jgi:hypothetical protein
VSATRISRGVLAAFAFGSTLIIGSISLHRNRQLGAFCGHAGQEFELGINLLTEHTFGVGSEPTVFKPPGTAFFDALVIGGTVGLPTTRLRSTEAFPSSSDLFGLAGAGEDYREQAARAVYWAQCVLLAGATALLFLWLSTRFDPLLAVLAALLFGWNAYSVILVGLLNYSVLHWFLTILSLWILQAAVQGSRSGKAMAWAGVAWGVTTLVRPVTLLLPGFVLVALVLSAPRDVWRNLQKLLLFCLGLGLIVGPWALRNYRLTGRFIPGSAQVWAALFHSSSRRYSPDPNEFRYKEFRDWYLQVQSEIAQREVTSQWEPYDVPSNLALEDAYKARVMDEWLNRQRFRGKYFHNAIGSFWSFLVDINGRFLGVFQALQAPGAHYDQRWLGAGRTPHFPLGASNQFAAICWALSLLSAAGIVVAIHERDPFLAVPGLVFLCFAVAYSLTWLEVLYYYIKLPFLFIFAFYFLDRTHRSAAPGWRAVPVALGVLVAVWTLWVSATVLWA